MSLSEAVALAKKHFGLPHVRVAVPVGALRDTKFTSETCDGAAAKYEVKSVACCAGCGSDALRDVKADLMVSGEMSHHDVLAHNHAGRAVLLTDHSNCERGYLPILEKRLSEALIQEGAQASDYNLIVTAVDADPLVVM